MLSTPTNLSPVLAAMQLTDSALPIGAFSHSLGFESYIHDGRITDASSFRTWLEMFCMQQLTFSDALSIRLVYAAPSFAEVALIDARLVGPNATATNPKRCGGHGAAAAHHCQRILYRTVAGNLPATSRGETTTRASVQRMGSSG